MLKAHWKGGPSTSATKPEAIGAGQIRSFRIAKMEPDARKIDLELV
jgi:small subunit ribosomal protein S1